MPRERNAFKLGVTVLVGLVLFFAAVLFIGGKSFEKRQPFVVRIGHDQNVPRLKAGAPVICGPQQVGTVTGVTTVEAPALDKSGPQDFLYFEVRGEVNVSLGLRSDCSIVVEGPLLGDNGQLRVVDRGTAPTPVSPDQPIYARASGFASDWARITRELDDNNPKSLLSQIKTQLDPMISHSLMAKLHRSLGDVNIMTANLMQSVDPSRKSALIAKVGSILDHINAITAGLKAELERGGEQTVLAKVHRGLDHVNDALAALSATIDENRAGIRRTIKGAENVTAKLDQTIIPAIEYELDRFRTESLLGQVHTALEGINSILSDATVVADKARRVATLSEDRVLTVVDNAKEASDHLKAVAKDLRRSPWRLIHKPTAVESKEAYILDAVREFAEASGHLDESAAQLDALLEAYEGRIPETDPTLAAIRERLKLTLERFAAAEDALWDQLDVR
ncbi:MAG: hypothetical protein V3W34_15800 [Phycisphaerae bacterium]